MFSFDEFYYEFFRRDVCKRGTKVDVQKRTQITLSVRKSTRSVCGGGLAKGCARVNNACFAYITLPTTRYYNNII